MDLLTFLFVYLLTFWTLLFCVLPWGNRPEEGEKPAHLAPGAPAFARIKKKFLITAVLSLVVTAGIFTLIKIDIIDFHDAARSMAAEDRL